MINAIISYIRDIFKQDESTASLEAYIATNDPKTPEDVERLEREYHEINRYNSLVSGKYY
jgi:hypothetical protein